MLEVETSGRTVHFASGMSMFDKTPEGYQKCFRPTTLEIYHFPDDMQVTWVYATREKVGSEVCQLKDVPVYGLFQVLGKVLTWQRLPKE